MGSSKDKKAKLMTHAHHDIVLSKHDKTMSYQLKCLTCDEVLLDEEDLEDCDERLLNGGCANGIVIGLNMENEIIVMDALDGDVIWITDLSHEVFYK